MPDPGYINQGLASAQVADSRQEHGRNTLFIAPTRRWWHMLKDILSEPMVLLLLIACALYFTLGDPVEGWFMAGAILFVVLMDVVHDFRSERALQTLRNLSQPRVTVIREGERVEIPLEDVVVDDLLVVWEGQRVAADAQVLQQNDLSVDESILTGESLAVFKSPAGDNRIFQGSTVSSGSGVARVTAVGGNTELGKLGQSLEALEHEPTPLQQKIDRFVRQMMWWGLVAFLVVLGLNLANGYAFWNALLFSLAFAMALIPEEIPVAFTTFMAFGAYRMTRLSVLVRQPRTVESLGSATVICLDKTGTITENRMEVAEVREFSGRSQVIAAARWAGEPVPFDAMEKAIYAEWEKTTPPEQQRHREMIHEYPLEGTPPMMTHVYGLPTGFDVYTKGAVERVLRVCRLAPELEKQAIEQTRDMASRGWRVLGVATANWPAEQPFPEKQDDFPWHFEGLLALYDPPKPNIRSVMEGFYNAGVEVKMVTGDFPETALFIARQSGIRVDGEIVTGAQVMNMPAEELRASAQQHQLFARMHPEAKLRLVESLKAGGEVVAMTGDGVNDAPALKAAQVGVAMGHRGSETARAAASMVLLDDDLTHMVDAVQSGRRIYNNLRKAIRYILSIHLPIVLIVLLPLVFGWVYPHIFSPLHVIFLELIMGPTCAIAYENEPGEPGGSRMPPDNRQSQLFSSAELWLSIIQGLVITAALLLVYQWGVQHGAAEPLVRSYVFVTLISANVMLTLVNRSFENTLVQTLFYPNAVIWVIILISMVFLALILVVPALRTVFALAPLGLTELGWCCLAGVASVVWFEGWKMMFQH